MLTRRIQMKPKGVTLYAVINYLKRSSGQHSHTYMKLLVKWKKESVLLLKFFKTIIKSFLIAFQVSQMYKLHIGMTFISSKEWHEAS